MRNTPLLLCTLISTFAPQLLAEQTQTAPAVPATQALSETSSAQSEKSLSQEQTCAMLKTLILASSFFEESKDAVARTQAIIDYSNFAQQEGAPELFVDQLRQLAAEPSDEKAKSWGEQLVQEGMVNIDSVESADAWRISSTLKPEQMMQLLKGELGSLQLLSQARPFSQEALSALSPELFAKQATAIKRALFFYYLYNKEDNHTISREHTAFSATIADESGAPLLFSRLLINAHNPDIKPQHRYQIKEYLEKLIRNYGIGQTDVRISAERNELSSQQVLKLTKDHLIDFASLFNLIPAFNKEASNEEAVAQIDTLIENALQMASLLEHIDKQKSNPQDIKRLYQGIPMYFQASKLFARSEALFIRKIPQDKLEELISAMDSIQKQLITLFQDKENLCLELVAFLYQFK